MWTAPWQDILTLLQHRSGASRVRPVDAAGMAAGPNALRGSGANPSHAFKYAFTQAGSPDPGSDRTALRRHVLANWFCLYWASVMRPSTTSASAVSVAVDHDGPGHTRDLVGQGDSSDLDRPTFHDVREPQPFRTMLSPYRMTAMSPLGNWFAAMPMWRQQLTRVEPSLVCLPKHGCRLVGLVMKQHAQWELVRPRPADVTMMGTLGDRSAT